MRQVPFRLLRSGRMPRTLLSNATTGALARPDIDALAASFHARSPCRSQQLRRVARQVGEALTSAGAVAAWSEVPQPAQLDTERTLSEVVVGDITVGGGSLADISLTEVFVPMV
jgi:hypothetical protein